MIKRHDVELRFLAFILLFSALHVQPCRKLNKIRMLSSDLHRESGTMNYDSPVLARLSIMLRCWYQAVRDTSFIGRTAYVTSQIMAKGIAIRGRR